VLFARRNRENAAAVALDARGEFLIGDDTGQRLAQDLDRRSRRGGGREEPNQLSPSNFTRPVSLIAGTSEDAPIFLRDTTRP